MGDDDVRLLVRGWILRSLAKKMPDNAAGDILNVHDAFPEVGIINGLECPTIFAGHLLEDVFDAKVIPLQTAQNFIDERAIFHNEKMSIENTGIVRSNGR